MNHNIPLPVVACEVYHIPPVFVENSRFHFGDFSNGGNDIFENHEIKTNVDVKDGRNESEEELNKMVFFETLLGAEGLKHFDHDDKVDYRTDERYQYFVEDVNRVDDESFIVVQDKVLEDDFWGDQVNQFSANLFNEALLQEVTGFFDKSYFLQRELFLLFFLILVWLCHFFLRRFNLQNFTSFDLELGCDFKDLVHLENIAE